MKKFMRIALVFALAGAALMYTGCTKDYSGDISDLNKKVSEQASALSALQTQVAAAQSSASEALSSAQNALKEAQAAAKAAADANNDAEVAALTTKIATIEGNIADLQAKVEALNGLEAKLNEVADQLKKDVNAKVDAALEEIQKELEKAIAQVEGNFSVDGIEHQTAIYASAKWAPENSASGKARLAKLAEVFPELAELKKNDVVETFGHLNFIVNPSSVVLDDTFKFALVGADGKDSGVVLGNPTPGININGIKENVKAGLNVWNVEVQKPAYNKNGTTKNVNKLALVVETAEGVYAQTNFYYGVEVGETGNFGIDRKKPHGVTFNFNDTKSENSFDALDSLFKFNGTLFKDYYIIEAVDPADVEEFGIEIDGSKISFTETPERTNSQIAFAITAVGVEGRTATLKDTITLAYTKSVAPNAELKANTITLGYNAAAGVSAYKVPVKYNVADFEFSALEWKTVYAALMGANVSATYVDKNGTKQDATGFDTIVTFFNNKGQEFESVPAADKYATVAAFGFYVDSEKTIPEDYTVTIATADKSTFVGKGELTVKNPEACPLKLAEALCDADGVLQIVGTSNGSKITYNLTEALVKTTGYIALNPTFTFTDETWKAAHDDNTETYVDNTVETSPTFSIPAATALKNLLYTPRNFSVKFEWFGNAKNTGKFEFKAEAVSPIYDEAGKGENISINTKNAKGEEVVNTTIYYEPGKNESAKADLTKATFSGKYVAGNKKGTTFEIKSVAAVPEKKFEWKDVAADKKFIDYSKPATTSFTNSIAHSNVSATRDYVVGNDNKLIEVSLEKALELGWITTSQFIEFNADPDGYTYYLSKDRWDDLFEIWSNYWDQGFEYNGQKVAKNTYIQNDEPSHGWEYVEAEIAAAKAKIEALGKGTDVDKLEKANYDYFVTLLGSAQLKTRIDDCLASDKPQEAKPGYVSPADEFETVPYFTCANAGEYTNYVKFNGEDTVPTAATKIKSIETVGTAAGKTTVEIPLTLNVPDKWGMTSKKEFKITVKVK